MVLWSGSCPPPAHRDKAAMNGAQLLKLWGRDFRIGERGARLAGQGAEGGDACADEGGFVVLGQDLE